MSKISCTEIESKFALDFIPDLGDSDKKLIFESIKCFKDPKYKPQNFQFVDGRDLRILSEFYSRYGEGIRF